jgi:hypothetical protein
LDERMLISVDTISLTFYLMAVFRMAFNSATSIFNYSSSTYTNFSLTCS